MSDISVHMEQTTIIEDLSAFGISHLEAKIYLHLLNKHPKTILEIAQELDIARTSVYDNVVKLAEKGLVQKIITFKSQQVQAYPIHILKTYIDNERDKIETLQKSLSRLEKHIAQSIRYPHATEVRYYHGVRGLQQMVWNTLQAKNERIGYSQFGMIDLVTPRFAIKYARELLEQKLPSRFITNPLHLDAWRLNITEFNQYRGHIQHCRVVDRAVMYVSGDTTIYNDILAIAHWEHGEIVGIEIENAEIVKAQRCLFELCWQQAQPVSVDLS